MARNMTVYSDMRRLKQMIASCKGKPMRILHDGVEYGVYQEFGFTHYQSGNAVPGHPFMTPAIDGVSDDFRKGWQQVSNLEQADDFVEIIARRAEGIAKANAPVDTGALRNSIAVDKPENFGDVRLQDGVITIEHS